MRKYFSNPQAVARHFLLGFIKHYEAIEFLWMHKLWRGIMRYGWFSRGLIAIAVLLGIQYFGVLWEWLDTSADTPWNQNSLMSLGESSFLFFEKTILPFFDGSRKYVILVLTEVVTFHAIRSTFSIVTGQQQNKSFKAFLQAQVRMIKIAAFSWGMELWIGIVIGIFFGWFDMAILEGVAKFVVACYFIGFALIDNFFEQYDMKIKESYQRTMQFAGGAFVLGLVFNGLLYVPLIGAVLAPSIGGVAATLLLIELQQRGEEAAQIAVIENEIEAA